MLKGIKLDDTLQESFSGSSYFGIISNFSQINTFVGVNNSGKSRFLRTIFSNSKKVKFIYEIGDSMLIQISKTCDEIARILDQLEGLGIKYKYRWSFDRYVQSIKENADDVLDEILNFYWYASTLHKNEFNIANPAYVNNLTSSLSRSKTIVSKLEGLIEELGVENNRISKIYIPILKGLRPIAKDDITFFSQDIYLERTQHDYFKQEVPNGLIFTGLSMYEWVKKLLLGDEDERNEIREFEIFLEQNVFRKRVNLIPKYDDDVLHIKIGEETQFPIYKLGDGLQTLLIILFPIFINRSKQHLIFIEEPETHLHPKWQRLLHKSMRTFTNHTYFIVALPFLGQL